MTSKQLAVYKNGDFAYGYFDEDKRRDGRVIYQSQKGPQYDGQFDRNVRQGTGKIVFDRTYKFTGNYDEDTKTGFGRFDSPQGILEGNFSNGQLNEYGRCFTKDGLFYEGFWSEGKKEGYGMEIQPNSDCYFGEFKKDKKEGMGLYLFAKGGYYYGFFKNNEKTNMGVLYSKFTYSYYFGHFENDRKSGRGMEMYAFYQLRLKDKSVYNGFYESNKRNGPGIMEYSNKSVYVGEWQNGQRSGKGRLDRGETVTSGNWEYDRIKMASAVDLDEIMKPVYEQKLPVNFEAFFRSTGHTFGEMVVPNLNLNTFIKPTLLEFLKIKSAEGFIKGHILRKVSNILEKQRMVKEISERIYRVYTNIPNHEPIFSPIGDRIDFKFQTGEFKIKWHGINFDNKKRPKFVLDHMIVSSDIIFGFGNDDGNKEYNLDGVSLPDGCVKIYQQYKGKEMRKFTCVAGPNYLAGMDDEENKIFMIPELEMWKGFFTKEDDPQNKIVIIYYMKFFEDKIYGFGRDKMGIYMISGHLKAADPNDASKKRDIEFSTYYERDYVIEFKGTITGDEIRGHWEGAPESGRFMLKNNPKYFVKNIVQFVQNSRDTGAVEKIIQQNTILAHLCLPSSAAIQMQKQKILKEKENKILKDRAQDDSEDDQSLDKLDTLVKPSKPKLVKSKSKLYQGEKSVYDVYRTSLAQKYYKDILSNYNNTDLGTSSLFEGKSKDKKDLDRSRDRKFKLNVVGAEKAEEDGDEDEMTSGQKGGTFSKSKKKSVSPGKSAKQINEDSNNKRRLIPCKVEDRRNPDSHGPGGSRSKSRKKYSETSGKKSYHQYMLDRQKKSMSKSNKLEEEKAKSKSVKKTGNNTAQKSSQKPVANADEQNVKREKDFGITVSEFKHVNPKTTSPQKSGKFKETSDLNKIVFKELKDVEEDSKAKDAKGGSKGRNASKSNDRSKSRGKASNTPDREGSKNFSDLSEIKADYSYDGESRNGSDREILKGNQKNISYEKGSGDDNSDYLLDQNSASKGDVDQEEEDSLIHITDPKKRENIRAYRLAKKLALEDQSKMNDYKSIVRRVCAFVSYKVDPTAPEKEEAKTTDTNRLKKANFTYDDDGEMLQMISRQEHAVIKQVESQSNQELLWRGTINQYGKQQEFFIESLLPFKDSFRGYMVFDDQFFTLLGDFEDSKDEKVRFSILAHHENNLAYRMWGHFERYELILNLANIGSLNFPLTLKMNFTSLPCTVYSEPYQTLYTGRARISDILFVMFYINEKLNMITGKKNKHGVYVANLYKGNSATENIILKQVKNPSRVRDRQALSFVDERGQIGFVIEVFEN